MEFDFRPGSYTFKHSISSEPPEEESESFKEHFHSMYELLYFIDGEADFMIQHTLYNLQPHSLLVVKPGELHHVRIKSDMPYERIVIRFDEADLPQAFRPRLRALGSVYDIEGTRLSEELLRFDLHHDLQEEEGRYHAFRSQLFLTLTYLLSSQNLRRPADEINEDIFRIMDYIGEHLTEIDTMEDLCAALHMSRSNLHKVFSSRFDTPVMSYIRTQKTTLAHSLLNEGFSPTEIPAHCGFNDYSSFYRAYKRIYKTAPSETRR